MTRLVWTLLLLLPVLGCREETAMLIFVDTDITAITEVRAQVETSDMSTVDSRTEGNFQALDRPALLTLVPDGDATNFTITVTGFDRAVEPPLEILDQRAVTRFEIGEALFLRMYLYRSCLSLVPCPPGETCDDGFCVPEARSGSEYDEDPDPIAP